MSSESQCYQLRGGSFHMIGHLQLQNRAFHYADGFFDTLLVEESEPVFWDHHARRTHHTASYLGLTTIDTEMVQDALRSLAIVKQSPFLRVRLTIYRAGGGRYFPSSRESELIAEIEPLEQDPWLNNQELTAEVAKGRWVWHPSDRFKLIAKHEQVRFAMEAQDRGFDELMIVNEAERLVGYVAGNILVHLEGQWLTPSHTDGALEGTLRQVLLDHSLISERSIAVGDLKNADAIARCNAIKGIQGISNQVHPEYTLGLHEELNKIRVS